MTEKPKAAPKLPPEKVLNPAYAGATPEMVALALLKHRPKVGGGKGKASRIIAKPAVRSSI